MQRTVFRHMQGKAMSAELHKPNNELQVVEIEKRKIIVVEFAEQTQCLGTFLFAKVTYRFLCS